MDPHGGHVALFRAISIYPAGERRDLVALGLFLRFLVYDHPYLSERWEACIQTALDAADKEVERLRLAGDENYSNHDLEAGRARMLEQRRKREANPNWCQNHPHHACAKITTSWSSMERTPFRVNYAWDCLVHRGYTRRNLCPS